MTQLRKIFITDADGSNSANIVKLDSTADADLSNLYAIVTASEAYARISAGEIAAVRADSSTHALHTIDYAHHEVHAGSHYTYSEVLHAAGAGSNINVVITTPDTTKWAHMVFNGYGGLHTFIKLFEDTTHSAGANIVAYDNNRNTNNTPTMVLNTCAWDGVDGTQIFDSQRGIDTGGGANLRAGGGENRAESEWVLKQNTKYLVVIESDAPNNELALTLGWYEHTDRS